MIKKIIDFLSKNIWRINTEDLPALKGYLVHLLQIVMLAVYGFGKNDCMRRASALTYYTLLSIVPVMAMAFGIAKGFGLEDALYRQLEHYLGAHEDILEQVVEFSYTLLEETRGGIIAGVGFIFLLWSVVKVLTNIELSFNAVWGIETPRGWVRKITEYISIMLIAPILIIMSGSMTVFLSTELGALATETRWLSFMDVLAGLVPRVLPYLLIWLLFIFLLMAMPNTRVKLKSAVIAGIISGTLFQIMQWVYITILMGTLQYNAVYGSFAALPLFLIWLQASWMIVLFGAELSFAHANVRRFIYASEVKDISQHHKHKISLLTMTLIIKNFQIQGQGTASSQIGDKLGLPPLLVNETIKDLVKAKLVVKISQTEEEHNVYQPGKDINILSISYVLQELQKSGSSDIPVTGGQAWRYISTSMDRFYEAVEKCPDNKLLKDMPELE